MFNPTEQLLSTGHQLLRMGQKLFKLPRQDGLPGAFRALMFNPAIQLSEMLDPLCAWPEPIEASEHPDDPFRFHRPRGDGH